MANRPNNNWPRDNRGADRGRPRAGGPQNGRQAADQPDQAPWDWEAAARNLGKAAAVCGLLVLAVAIIYGQTVRHEFIVCDDEPYIYGNPYVAPGWKWDNVKWAMTGYHAGNWHPLTWMSHMVDVQVYGLHAEKPDPQHPEKFKGPQPWKGPEAGWHHLTSVALHAAGAVALFLALWELTGQFWLSALVAAMFAVHPLRVESVAWAAERKDVLSGLFWMLTLLAYACYVRRAGRGWLMAVADWLEWGPAAKSVLAALLPVGWYLAVVLAFALGLTAKSMLVTLPCILLLLDVWPLRRVAGWSETPKTKTGGSAGAAPSVRCQPQTIGWLLVEKLPLFALAGGVCAIIMYVQRAAGAMSMTKNLSVVLRVANAAVAYVMYLWKTVVPINMAICYPYADPDKIGPWVWPITFGLLAAVLLGAITALVLLGLRRRPYLAVGWFWYLGALVPVIGLVRVGIQAYADRYTYLPMIGVYVMVVWGAAELVSRYRFLRLPLVAATTLLLGVWTVLAAHQTATWQNSITVFQHAVDVTQDNYFAENHLGLAYHSAGEAYMEKAGEHYRKAVDAGPNYDSASGNLGVYFAHRSSYYANCAERFQHEGDAKQAAECRDKSAEYLDKAAKCFRHASEINPYLSSFHANLGMAYLAQNKLPAAESQLRWAVKLEPFSIPYRANLRVALARQAKTADVLGQHREMIQMNPNDPVLLNETAWMLSANWDPSLRNGEEAVRYAERAVQLTEGKVPTLLGTLAAAYAEAGRFGEAERIAGEAIDLALKQGRRELADSIGAKLELYKARKPFHEPRPSSPPGPGGL
jgi:protein O-mannosyl-transferase